MQDCGVFSQVLLSWSVWSSAGLTGTSWTGTTTKEPGVPVRLSPVWVCLLERRLGSLAERQTVSLASQVCVNALVSASSCFQF